MAIMADPHTNANYNPMTIHPLISYLVASGGFDGTDESWPELAAKFDLVSGEAAFGRWKRFLGSDRSLEFKKANVNPKTGELLSVTMGRAMEPKEIPDFEGSTVKFITTTPNGGAFVRREFKDSGPPPITDQQRADIERKVSEKPIQRPSASFHQNILIIGCVHRPFHDKKIWAALLSFIYDNRDGIHGIVINGDYLDMKSLSSHDEKKLLPFGIDLGVEYQDGYEGIQELKQAFGVRWNIISKDYTYGNHEARYFKHIGQFDHSKYGTALMSPHEAMKLEEEGFNLQLDWENGRVFIGDDLEAFHGFYLGPNAVKKHLEKSDRNILMNHTHAVAEFKLNGRRGYNIGWMGDENSPGFTYANRFMVSGWEKCFAIATVLETGKTIVNRTICENGGFIFGNKRY